jgi:hypothetical protein
MNRSIRFIAVVVVVLAGLYLILMAIPPTNAPNPGGFLAGTYSCDEYEFGLIWQSKVVTLDVDGNYYASETKDVAGKWAYLPATQELTITNFRWAILKVDTATRLWNSQYLTHAGFDVAIKCTRRK